MCVKWNVLCFVYFDMKIKIKQIERGEREYKTEQKESVKAASTPTTRLIAFKNNRCRFKSKENEKKKKYKNKRAYRSAALLFAMLVICSQYRVEFSVDQTCLHRCSRSDRPFSFSFIFAFSYYFLFVYSL